jgi:hypothetical protein
MLYAPHNKWKDGTDLRIAFSIKNIRIKDFTNPISLTALPRAAPIRPNNYNTCLLNTRCVQRVSNITMSKQNGVRETGCAVLKNATKRKNLYLRYHQEHLATRAYITSRLIISTSSNIKLDVSSIRQYSYGYEYACQTWRRHLQYVAIHTSDVTSKANTNARYVISKQDQRWSLTPRMSFLDEHHLRTTFPPQR